MKTTEIFVEQVLIGLLVLAYGALPYIDWDDFKRGSLGLGEGAAIVAIAYLLGIVFDRFADTLLSRLEGYHRLKFANKKESDENEKKPTSNPDPFPEGYLRARILSKSGGAAEWMDYLRSRIRLSRALAVFTPALTLSVLFAARPDFTPDYVEGVTIPLGFLGFVSKSFHLTIDHVKGFTIGMTALIYVASFIRVLMLFEREGWKLPKTGEGKDKIDYAMKNFSLWREPTTIAAGALAVLAITVVIYFFCCCW